MYDRCITDLRSQLDHDGDAESSVGSSGGAVLAVRPVIRQPRALTRAEEAKSPTPTRTDSEVKTSAEPESIKEAASFPAEGQSPRKVVHADASSNASSIATDIRTEAEESPEANEEIKEQEADSLADLEKSAADSDDLSTDPSSAVQDYAAEASDSGRADPFNQTMIIKSDSQVKDELAEEISKSILEELVEETITITTEHVLKSRSPTKSGGANATSPSATDVLQRVSVILSAGSDQKSDRSQLYLTTTFDVSSSPDEVKSPDGSPVTTKASRGPSFDVNSAEGRSALESKLSELQVENDEWMDDDLQSVPVSAEGAESDENRDRVIQEAEALEREQKRIEQEIQKLSSSGSLLYLQREIPNKPPPPYTPPGQALTWQKIRPAPVEIQRVAPKTKEEVVRYCRRFTDYLLDHIDNPTVSFPEGLYAVEYQVPDQPPECQINCRAFMTLLADLCRLFVSELSQRATFIPGSSPAVSAGRPIRSRGELADKVEEAVLIQFNYRPRLRREGQLAKWSQKKRDRVDEILVKELQTEEKLWTDFSAEEAQVKRQTADAILDMLLEETVQLYKQILHSKRTVS